MGSVAPPFILCPLSESKELVGINADRMENRVIVTLGKNIAIRYHVLEQKQEASWTCSRHWFTAPVIYCPDFEKYGSIIDNNQVILWEENDAHLANRKKYKFTDSIHSLKSTKDGDTLVIFNDGTVRSLTEAISNRSLVGRKTLDEEKEVIDDVIIDEKTNRIYLISKTKPLLKPTSKCGMEKAKTFKLTTINFPGSDKVEDNSFVNVIHVELEGGEILGRTIAISPNSTSFIYLCSDGFLYRRQIESSQISPKDTINEEKIANLEKLVSKSTPAIISALNPSTIVIYGCDPSEEGATVFLYDIAYDLMLSKQSLKLFGTPTIMFTIGNNVFVPVGLHLLVLGLRLTKSLLSSMLGKHQIQGVDFFENRDPWVKPWEEGDDDGGQADKKEDDMIGAGFQDLVELVRTLELNGQPQSMICGQIIPQALEKGETNAISWIIEYFHDIPEHLLVRVLEFYLSTLTRMEVNLPKRKSLTNATVNGGSPDSQVLENGKPEPYTQNPALDSLLNRPFDQKQMTKSLHTIDFQVAKEFLEYLLTRVDNSWSLDVESEEETTRDVSQLLKWTGVVLDAFYPQFVFNDETSLVESTLVRLQEKFAIMDDIQALEPLLILTLSKTSYTPDPSPRSKYRLETVVFE